MRVLAIIAVAGCGRIGFDPVGGAGGGDVPKECDMRGLRTNAPWPMDGYCPAHIGRTGFDAPLTKPTTEIYRRPNLELDAVGTMGIAIDADGTVYVEHGETNPEVFATDLRSQTPLWQLPAPGGNGPYTPTIGADGTVWLICAADATSWCGRTPQGTIVTVSRAGSDVVRSAATIGGDGLLRWVDSNHFLHAAGPGAVGWSSPRASNAIDGSTPTVTKDGRTFITDDRGVETVFDASGGLITTIDPNLVVPGNFGSSVTITADGSSVYPVVSGSAIVVVPPSLTTPSVVALPADAKEIAEAADGTLYVVDVDHAIHIVRAGVEIAPPIAGWTEPILSGNGVLLAGADFDLLAYDITRMPPRLLWTYTFDTGVTTVRLAANGRIVVGTIDGSGTTGSLRAIE